MIHQELQTLNDQSSSGKCYDHLLIITWVFRQDSPETNVNIAPKVNQNLLYILNILTSFGLCSESSFDVVNSRRGDLSHRNKNQ